MVIAAFDRTLFTETGSELDLGRGYIPTAACGKGPGAEASLAWI